MGTDHFTMLGMDPSDPRVRAAQEDAEQAERLIDTLVDLRADQGLPQVEVARRMETTQSAVSKFEHAGGDPRLSTLYRYARAVGARLRWVVSTSPQDSAIWESRYPLPTAETTDPHEEETVATTPAIRLAA